MSITNEQLFGLAFLIVAGVVLLENWRLARWIVFSLFWQSLTPVRGYYLDIPLLIIGFVASELVFLNASKR